MTIVSAVLAIISAGVAAYSNKYELRRPLLSCYFLVVITFLCLPQFLALAARALLIALALPTAKQSWLTLILEKLTPIRPNSASGTAI